MNSCSARPVKRLVMYALLRELVPNDANDKGTNELDTWHTHGTESSVIANILRNSIDVCSR